MQTFFELAAEIDSKPISKDAVSKIETAYSCTLPEFARHLVSLPVDAVDHRQEPYADLMTLNSILDADQEYGYDFKAGHLVPILDLNDGNFACYDAGNDQWCCVNVYDELVYQSSDSLIAML